MRKILLYALFLCACLNGFAQTQVITNNDRTKTIHEQNEKLAATEKQLNIVVGKFTRQKPHSRK